MTRSRALALALAAGAMAALAAGPAAASPTQAPGCDVRDATLTWGFKESFRAYIDGGIANGEWTTSGDATYETPEFRWSGGQGRYNSDTGSGFVEFSGSVRFTGHGGVLDTTFSDPAIVFAGDTATLVLDVAGASMDGDQIAADDVAFVELTGIEFSGEDALVTVDAATVLTDDGEAAFPDYRAGTAFDPVALEMPTSGVCAAGSDGGDAIAPPADEGLPAMLIGFVVGVPLLLIAAVLAVTLSRRRRRRA
jgi:hypothetical protein